MENGDRGIDGAVPKRTLDEDADRNVRALVDLKDILTGTTGRLSASLASLLLILYVSNS